MMTTKPLVLIIDDVLDNVRVLGEALSGFCRIQFAESGEEGLTLVSAEKPDLILLDVMMPGMNGYEAFSAFRGNTLTEDIPVIFVTAKNDAASESEALHAGAADFIHKPINVDVARARVKQQLALTRQRKYLETQIIKRTQELAVARSEAESANAVKTRFMSNVSHEMRTPLQGILGFAEIGLRNAKGSDPEKLETYFSTIQASGKRLLMLVESLLSLAEQAHTEHTNVSAADRQEIQTENFINEVVSLMSLLAESRQQQLILDLQSTAASFSGDPHRLRQVMEHLITNALAYSPKEASVSIRVSDAELPAARRSGRSAAALSFQIIDNGCGIPETEIKAIFEPFYQSERTATGAGGTGLGLPLSRCIVARHGGTLTIENRPQGGVVATMILPVAPPTH